MPSRPPVHAAYHAAVPTVHVPEPRPDMRPSPDRRGYDETWRRARRMFLRRHPMCATPGCNHPATDVHHVHTIAAGGPRLDEGNLQALCHACHSRITAHSRGGSEART